MMRKTGKWLLRALRVTAIFYLCVWMYLLLDYWMSGALGGFHNIFRVVSIIEGSQESAIDCHGFSPSCSRYMFTASFFVVHLLIYLLLFLPWRKLLRMGA